jgi:hypothetical protein
MICFPLLKHSAKAGSLSTESTTPKVSRRGEGTTERNVCNNVPKVSPPPFSFSGSELFTYLRSSPSLPTSADWRSRRPALYDSEPDYPRRTAENATMKDLTPWAPHCCFSCCTTHLSSGKTSGVIKARRVTIYLSCERELFLIIEAERSRMSILDS